MRLFSGLVNLFDAMSEFLRERVYNLHRRGEMMALSYKLSAAWQAKVGVAVHIVYRDNAVQYPFLMWGLLARLELTPGVGFDSIY